VFEWGFAQYNGFCPAQWAGFSLNLGTDARVAQSAGGILAFAYLAGVHWLLCS
jgi:hypothetical protein